LIDKVSTNQEGAMLFYQFLQPLGIFMLLIGLASCFFGYEIYKAFIRVTGFFIGAAIGLVLALLLRSGTEISIILALVFGVLGAVLAVPLNFLLLFLEGGINGAIITAGALLLLFNMNPANSIGIIAVGFIISGILMVVYKIGFTIISSSISGAIGIVLGIAFMTRAPLSIIILLAIIVISAVGMWVQFGRLGGQKKNLGYPAAPSYPTAPSYAAPQNFFAPVRDTAPQSFTNVPLPNPAVMTSPPVVFCPNCKNFDSGGGTYCGICGSLLPGRLPTEVPCPTCKSLNPIGSKYCGICGCALAGTVPQTPTEPDRR
jgi:hypothetical protein